MFKKVLIFILTIFVFTHVHSQEVDKAYFGGGCFWCMEESFEKVNGVIEVISGYSGGTKPNPTYKEVTYGNTGHFEVVEIVYDKTVINFERILEIFWKNIDPFDSQGQFCDKGYSYRSVAFYRTEQQRQQIAKSIKKIEQDFNEKVVTYVRKFEKFYIAEENHQNYYQDYFVNYLLYKKGCGREKKLKNIWSQ